MGLFHAVKILVKEFITESASIDGGKLSIEVMEWANFRLCMQVHHITPLEKHRHN
jgi:hypothetical protein